ncbi:MAG TPA: hypothetical protein PKC14_03460, partial [Candidatus Absconditabacterales bacterium]|nr:hypothetical protein [Candidatus Absconditabacterales bacterium]
MATKKSFMVGIALTALFFGSLASQTTFASPIMWLTTGAQLDNIEEAVDVVSDSAGNTYAAYVFGTATTIGGTTVTAIGDVDSLIVKLDSQGNVVWTTSMAGIREDRINSLAIGDDGNLIAGGRFTDTTNAFGTTLTSVASSDIVVAKIDATNGMGLMVTAHGGIGADTIGEMKVSGGFVYIVGHFDGTSQIFGSSLTTVGGSTDIFFAKVSQSDFTTAVWVKTIAGVQLDPFDPPANGHEIGKDIGVDSNGNVFILGTFTDNYIEPATGFLLTLNGAGFSDSFVAKFDQNGDGVRATKLHSTSWYDEGRRIAVSPSGEVFVVGYYGGRTVPVSIAGFTPFFAVAERNSFFQKLASDGSVVLTNLGVGANTT